MPLTRRSLLASAATGAASLLLRPANAAVSRADELIHAVEQRSRLDRILIYLQQLNGTGYSKAERLSLITALSKHMVSVSPYYSHSRAIPFWACVNALKEGNALEPTNCDIGMPLSRFLIDDQKYDEARGVLEPLREQRAKMSIVYQFLYQPWVDWVDTERRRELSPVLSFPVHFCVLTKNPYAHQVATESRMKGEVEILNAKFRSLRGERVVGFRFGSYSSYQDIKDSNSELLSFGDASDFSREYPAFDACKDEKVRSPREINFYIFDDYSPTGDPRTYNSRGHRSGDYPWVMIDWASLYPRTRAAAEEHEMGHAFCSAHVGIPPAGPDPSSNIMCTATEDFGGGDGRRDLGFTEAQVAQIKYFARRSYDCLLK